MEAWPVIGACIHRMKSWHPKWLDGYSFWRFFSFTVEAFAKGKLATRAAAISFRLFLAFFPAIIVLLTLIPYVPVENFQQSLFDSIRFYFPGDTFSLFESTFEDLIHQKHSALLSVGFVLVLFYASNSINGILIGFNESYHLERKNHPIMMRVSSIILIFVLGFLMTLAVTLIVFSEVIFNYLHELGVIGDRGYIPILSLADWGISLLLIYAIVSTLYNVGARRKLRKWKFWNAGATVATVSFLLTSMGFAYFVNNFSSYNKLYGSLGSLLVLLIWLNVNCMIVLIGFDLNVSIRKAKRELSEPPAPPKEPPRNTYRESVQDSV
jgi:membrane protein